MHSHARCKRTRCSLSIRARHRRCLGRTTSNTLTLSVDATGLKFDCVLPDTTTANDLIVLVNVGHNRDVVGFVCISDVWSEDSDGRYIRTLLDVDLFEITVTSSPAIHQPLSVSAPHRKRFAARSVRSATPDCKCLCDVCVDSDGETVRTARTPTVTT